MISASHQSTSSLILKRVTCNPICKTAMFSIFCSPLHLSSSGKLFWLSLCHRCTLYGLISCQRGRGRTGVEHALSAAPSWTIMTLKVCTPVSLYNSPLLKLFTNSGYIWSYDPNYTESSCWPTSGFMLWTCLHYRWTALQLLIFLWGAHWPLDEPDCRTQWKTRKALLRTARYCGTIRMALAFVTSFRWRIAVVSAALRSISSSTESRYHSTRGPAPICGIHSDGASSSRKRQWFTTASGRLGSRWPDNTCQHLQNCKVCFDCRHIGNTSFHFRSAVNVKPPGIYFLHWSFLMV